MQRLLTQTDQFDVVADFEMASLVRREGFFSRRRRSVLIGDFYGEPEAAAFSPDGSLVVVVGCGLIVYRLREPFQNFEYNLVSPQWIEMKREAHHEWWIESVRWIGARQFLFCVDPLSDAAGCYQATVIESGTLQVDIEPMSGNCNKPSST